MDEEVEVADDRVPAGSYVLYTKGSAYNPANALSGSFRNGEGHLMVKIEFTSGAQLEGVRTVPVKEVLVLDDSSDEESDGLASGAAGAAPAMPRPPNRGKSPAAAAAPAAAAPAVAAAALCPKALDKAGLQQAQDRAGERARVRSAAAIKANTAREAATAAAAAEAARGIGDGGAKSDMSRMADAMEATAGAAMAEGNSIAAKDPGHAVAVLAVLVAGDDLTKAAGTVLEDAVLDDAEGRVAKRVQMYCAGMRVVVVAGATPTVEGPIKATMVEKLAALALS